MIKIGNIRNGDEGEYCARPSPLGNPFVLHGNMDREYTIDLYEKWFLKEVKECNAEILQELKRLKKIHKEAGELTLLCFCAPLRCHCDIIKRYLDNETI